LSSFKDSGYDVLAMSAPANEKTLEQLCMKGVAHRSFSVKRNGLNPFSDLKIFFQLYREFKSYKPSVVFSYTIKPVIWGGLAARLSRTPFYALITGLGFAFQGDSLKRKLLTLLVCSLYRAALKRSKAVIFQNSDNAQLFVDFNIVPHSKCKIVNGSGVNIDAFKEKSLPEICYKRNELVFLCVARLLKEKGLREYAEAAKLVKHQYPYSKFILVGPLDPSPDGISLEEVNGWGSITYQGETNNVKPHIESSHVYVLPSYHEGLPRSTLEAMAVGRAVLTTTAVGCKETVEDGVNGFKVPVGDSEKLAEKMIWCLENKERLADMGAASRRIVTEKFDVKIVNRDILDILEVHSEARL